MMMQLTSEQAALYERLQSFDLDQPDAPFCLSRRLARENGWSSHYTQQVIEEYKKFVFLAIVAGHPVTPSDQVDQVWHLHLTYTRSYWQEFCPQVLQQPLHHEPTRGGLAEQVKFDCWYGRTLESYQQFFQQVPPVEIWSKPSDRFGRDLQFVRVNTQQHWVIPKPALPHVPTVRFNSILALAGLLLLTTGLTGCQFINKLPNPLNFTGGWFLAFYIVLSIVVLAIAVQLQTWLSRPKPIPAVQDVDLSVYETAYLAGGERRVVETAIASLVQRKIITVETEQNKFILNQPSVELSDPVEQAIIDSIAADGQLNILRSSISSQVFTPIKQRLQPLEWQISPNQVLLARLVPTLLLLALLALGVTKIFVGMARQKPVGFLIGLCIFLALMTFGILIAQIEQRGYHTHTLNPLRSRVRATTVRPAADPQLPLAFALWGATILPYDEFPALKTMLMPPSSSSSYSSGGGGDGGGCGGGGGGGGCGGCGGCGG